VHHVLVGLGQGLVVVNWVQGHAFKLQRRRAIVNTYFRVVCAFGSPGSTAPGNKLILPVQMVRAVPYPGVFKIKRGAFPLALQGRVKLEIKPVFRFGLRAPLPVAGLSNGLALDHQVHLVAHQMPFGFVVGGGGFAEPPYQLVKLLPEPRSD
jgi:hypothetical protein